MRKKRLSLGYFDMVFSDLGIPGMSGWEVARSIKNWTKKLSLPL